MLPLLLALATTAHANDRRFTYTYETMVLPKGVVEIEPWVTVKPSGGLYSFDNRMEFEFGVTDRVQTALYLKWAGDVGGMTWDGVASEWKVNLASRAVAPVGVALYGELGLSPTESAVEGKLLLDKELGKLLVAFNGVGELKIERELELEASGETEVEHEREVEQKNILAAAWRPNTTWGFGLEAVNANEWVMGEGHEETTISVGPAISASQPSYWAALTGLVHVGEVGDEGFEMPEQDRWEARLLLGFPL